MARASNKFENQQKKNKNKKKVSTAKRKKSRNLYSTDILMKALEEIKSGESLNKVSIKYSIPKSTLSNKINGKSAVGCKMGPSSILYKEEEDYIVNWIVESSERGFPVTKARLIENVKNYLISVKRSNSFKNGQPGRHWFEAFMKRNPVLTQRIAQNLTTTRAAVTEAELRQWFAKIEENLKTKNLLEIEPHRVFNLDESSFKLVPKVDKVVTEKGLRNVYKIVSVNEKACVTVLFTASASGEMAPPLILFDLKNTPNRNTLNLIPKGWGVGQTEGGWMTGESFFSFIKNIFHPWLLKNEIQFPILLYVDNHASHINLDLLSFCKEKKIEIIALYPNSTHILQPLDVAFFHPLKEEYKKASEKYKEENKIINLKKSMVAPIIQMALESRNFKEGIINGFRSSGLFPFNADSVNYNILSKKSKKSKSSQQQVENLSMNELSTDKDAEFLSFFETRFIDEQKLKDFKENEFCQVWEGEPTDLSLFETWRKMRRQYGI